MQVERVSKESAADYLTAHGYLAEVIDGTVWIRDPVNRKQKAEIFKLFDEIGYDMSCGMRLTDPEPSWYEKFRSEKRKPDAPNSKQAAGDKDQLPGQMSIFDMI